MNQGILGATQQVQGQTSLLALQEAREKQRAEQEYLLAIQNDPDLRARLFGDGSVIGSLQTAPGGPPGGPLTQQSVMPGQPPGPPPLPGSGSGPPPQSTIASLGPQGGMPGQQMQPQRNPVLEMASRDPRTAMMMQQQIQAQQDRQWKMQEQQLGMGVKVAEFVARELQGVTDQASLDQARERIRQVHPQAAAQVPQMYSKEAVESVQQRGIAIADRALSQLNEAKARHEDVKTQYLPKLFEDAGTPPAAQAPAGESVTQAPAVGAGNMGQRMNNPYNIKLGKSTQHWVDEGLAEVGESAQDGGKFIKFKDPQVGERAGLELLQGPGYRDLSVDAAMKRWSNNGYGAEIIKDIPPETKIKDLSAAQMRPLMAAMREREGWNAKPTGSSTAQAATAPDPRIAQLETQIATAERKAQQYGAMGYESNATQEGNKAQRLAAERTRLLAEQQRQQERSEEISRAVKKQTAELEAKQKFERERQAGPILPEDRRKHLAGLRESVLKEPTFKIYQDVRNGYQNVKVGAASNSAQGDLAIFNGLAKILDPTSSVMSGEAKNIEEAQGQLQIWFNSPAKFLDGDRISKDNRPRFLKMAYDLAKEKLTTAQTELETVWGPLAKEVGIDFKQVVPLPDLKPLEPGPNVSKFEKILEKN